MKKVVMIMLVMLISIVSVNANVPEDVNVNNNVKIQEEHVKTRLMIKQTKDDVVRDFFSEFENMASSYKGQLENMINTGVVKLGLMWLGVTLFTQSLFYFFRLRLKKKEYPVLMEALKKDIKRELDVEMQMRAKSLVNEQYADIPKVVERTNPVPQPTRQVPPPPKLSFVEKLRAKRLEKERVKKEAKAEFDLGETRYKVRAGEYIG